MHAAEAIVLALLFFVFFKATLSPGSHSYHDTSSLFNWLLMTLELCYLIAVWLRPVTFYVRSSREGSVAYNALLTVVYAGMLFFAFIILVERTKVVAAWRLLELFAVFLVLITLWRYALRAFIRFARSRGRNLHSVVFLGAGDNVVELYEEMRNPFYGYRVQGYFNAEPVGTLPEGLKYLGTVADAVPYMQQHGVQQLYCCLPSAMAADIRPVITWCEHNFVRFFSVQKKP